VPFRSDHRSKQDAPWCRNHDKTKVHALQAGALGFTSELF